MTSIDNLFDWLLEDIFKLLTRKDRLICKLVRKSWYNMLMERACFRNDRHIFVKRYEIIAGRPPMDVLINAKKPYEIYTVDDSYICLLSKDDLLQFFDVIGPSILEINYKGLGSFFNIIDKMPSLKSLTFSSESLNDVERRLSAFKEKNPNFTFHQLEKLQVKIVEEYNNVKAISDINKIKEVISHNCSIVLSKVYVRNDKEIDILYGLMEITKIQKIVINTWQDKRNLSQSKIEEMLLLLKTENENLRKITYQCVNLPPSVSTNLPKLTTLNVEFNTKYSPKYFEQFTNVKSLKLNFNDVECGFGHEAVKMPKLKKLRVEMTFGLCRDCLKTVANSFENIEDFHFDTLDKFLWADFQILTSNWLINLRSLCIRTFTVLKISDIKNLGELCPNMEELTLSVHFFNGFDLTFPVAHIIKAVVPAFKKLTEFSFFYDYDDDDEVYDGFEIPADYDIKCTSDCNLCITHQTICPLNFSQCDGHEIVEGAIIFAYLVHIGLPLKNLEDDDLSMDPRDIFFTINRKTMTSILTYHK